MRKPFKTRRPIKDSFINLCKVIERGNGKILEVGKTYRYKKSAENTRTIKRISPVDGLVGYRDGYYIDGACLYSHFETICDIKNPF